MSYESIMVKPYTVKPGDTPSGVANMFGVSVDELQNYNKAVLGLDNRFGAGIQLRDPNEKAIVVQRAYEKGAPPEQIAEALRINESDVLVMLGLPSNNLFKDDFENDLVIPEDVLKEIEVTAKRQNPNVEYVLS